MLGDETAPFHGSSEHGLLLARAKIDAGRRALHRRRFAAAAVDLQAGCLGLEDAFDRLSEFDEIPRGWLLAAKAELAAGHRAEAAQAAEVVARLSPDLPLASLGKGSALQVLLADAMRRVSQGPRGTLRVTSVVKGQAFYLDGKPAGRTPARLELSAGRHFILVETPLGQIPYRVEVEEGANLRVGQGETDEITPDLVDLGNETTPAARAARRPVLPHRR